MIAIKLITLVVGISTVASSTDHIRGLLQAKCGEESCRAYSVIVRKCFPTNECKTFSIKTSTSSDEEFVYKGKVFRSEVPIGEECTELCINDANENNHDVCHQKHVICPTTFAPTELPTYLPTTRPSNKPTISPTYSPSFVPTIAPSMIPTTSNPSRNPTVPPSATPTFNPTFPITSSPTTAPTFGGTFAPLSRSLTRMLGSNSEDEAMATIVDSDNNVYVSGFYYGTSFDGYSNSGYADGFLTKYDSTGTKQWTRVVRTGVYDHYKALQIDSGGNILAAGWASGSIDGKTYLGGYGDLIIQKYSTSGVLDTSWTIEFGSQFDESLQGMVLDQQDNMYVVGRSGVTYYGGSNNIFYGETAPSTPGGQDICYLAKISSAGVKQWVRFIDGVVGCNAVVYDGVGAIYTTGHAWKSVDSQPFSSSSDVYVAKYDLNGNRVWSRMFGSSGADYGRGIAYDAAIDAIYVTGESSGTITGVATGLGGSDFFLAKYSSSGTREWLKLMGSYTEDGGNAVMIDDRGLVYVTGYSWSPGTIEGNIPTFGDNDIILYIFDRTGQKLLTQVYGSNWQDSGTALCLSKDKTYFILAGFASGSIDGRTWVDYKDMIYSKLPVVS